MSIDHTRMNVRPRNWPVLAASLATLLLGACAEPSRPPRTTVEMMDDPVLLQMVLARCNQSGDLRDRECSNARDAVERLAASESAELKKHKAAQAESDFERAREQLRLKAERERMREEAREQRQTDPYTLPLVKEGDEAVTAPMQGEATHSSPPAAPST
ncbi:MAG: hypothetical protein HC872_03810 [Gammaproteobacteria bacterium]|nr:hypothetical protein [Gammaproteobacteria bacterium]